MKNQFKTKKEVVQFLESASTLSFNDYFGGYEEDGIYVLSHGELERPTYHPRRYKDGWGIHVQYYYLPNTYNCPESGRLSDVFIGCSIE
jgi:hypothetical protein